jgi:hypothetical protein
VALGLVGVSPLHPAVTRAPAAPSSSMASRRVRRFANGLVIFSVEFLFGRGRIDVTQEVACQIGHDCDSSGQPGGEYRSGGEMGQD